MEEAFDELERKKQRATEVLRQKEEERDQLHEEVTEAQYIQAARQGGSYTLSGRQVQEAMEDGDHVLHDHAADQLARTNMKLQSLNRQITIAEDNHISQRTIDDEKRKIRDKKQEKLRLENSLRSAQTELQRYKREIDGLKKEIERLKKEEEAKKAEEKRREEEEMRTEEKRKRDDSDSSGPDSKCPRSAIQ